MRQIAVTALCICVVGVALIVLGNYLALTVPIVQAVDGLSVEVCARALHREIPGSRLSSPETGFASGVYWVLGRTRVGGVTYGYYCELDEDRVVRYTEVLDGL